MIPSNPKRAVLALCSALLAAGFSTPATAGYSIVGSFVDASTIRYEVRCDVGEPSFNAVDLHVDPSDQASAFSLVMGPPGWSFAPDLVTRGGGVFARATGPALTCPADNPGHVFEVHYAGSQGQTSYAAAVLASDSTELHKGLCVPGWFTSVICDPDPPNGSCPNWIFVVGAVDGGARPDAQGSHEVVVRDFANNPVPNARVTIDFSGCCDIDLCSAVVNGQTVDCPNNAVTGFTNAAGRFRFAVMGAARDPGNIAPCGGPPGCVYPGAGVNGVSIWFNAGSGDVKLCNATAVCLDQNGATGLAGTNGTSIGDVANLFNLFGGVALGGSYKGRADLNCDGRISIADVAAEFVHFGRLAVSGGSGCPVSFCGKPACP